MAYHISIKDPHSDETEKILKQIPACPGTCIFIDLINSTSIKYEMDICQWGKKLNNTFNFISFLNDFPKNIVKGIGDEIMVYIPEEALLKKQSISNYYCLLEEIYATIHNIKNYPDENFFLHCKVSIHYCTDAYNITFLEGLNDYYGKDIDLASRLMGLSAKNRIVFTEAFFERVLKDFEKLNLQLDKTCLKNVTGKFKCRFKGVPTTTEYRMIDV